MTVLPVLRTMFSCPQSINMYFTKQPRIPSCPPCCFYCCFELLPSGRFLWWESCVFQDNPLQNSSTPSCVKWCHLPCYLAPPHLTLGTSHPVFYTPQSDIHVWVPLDGGCWAVLCRQILSSHVACLCHRERSLYHGMLSAWMYGVCLWPVWQWQQRYSNLFLIHFHMSHSPCSFPPRDTSISAQNIIDIHIIVLLLKKGVSSYKNLREGCRRDSLISKALAMQVWGPEFRSPASA